MLNEFRTQKLSWDKAHAHIHQVVSANGGDANGRKLQVQIVNNGVVEDLTGASVSLAWKTKNGANFGLDAFEAIDATKGIFEIYYTTEMLTNEGVLRASLVLIDTVGRVESNAFALTVYKSNIDDDAVQGENSFTALTQALISVNDLEANYAPQLQAVTAQLAQMSQYRPPVIERYLKKPTISAHRNLYKTFPENTIVGMYECHKLGIEFYEIDVFKTLDGEWVVIHDETTTRTTGVNLNVEQSTLADLKALDQTLLKNASLYGNPKIPTLDEVFTFIQQTRGAVHVNFKRTLSAADRQEILDKIYAYNIQNNVILQSQFLNDVKEIACTADVPLTDKGFKEAREKGNVIAAFSYGWSTPPNDVNNTLAAMALASKYSVPVLIYNVENYQRFRELDKTGVTTMYIDNYWVRGQGL